MSNKNQVILKGNVDKIARYFEALNRQRQELEFLVAKQLEEKQRLEMEFEKLKCQLVKLNRSLGQRMRILAAFEQTLGEIDERYKDMVDTSQNFLHLVKDEAGKLEKFGDKKIGTHNNYRESQDLNFYTKLTGPVANAYHTLTHVHEEHLESSYLNAKHQATNRESVEVFKFGYKSQHEPDATDPKNKLAKDQQTDQTPEISEQENVVEPDFSVSVAKESPESSLKVTESEIIHKEYLNTKSKKKSGVEIFTSGYKAQHEPGE